MSGWRVRAEGELLVLQVYVPPEVDGGYQYSSYRRPGTWRDATVSDIPVVDPFERERSQQEGKMRADFCPFEG